MLTSVGCVCYMLKLTENQDLLIIIIYLYQKLYFWHVPCLNKFYIMNFLKQRVCKNKQNLLVVEEVQRGLTCMIKGYREIDL